MFILFVVVVIIDFEPAKSPAILSICINLEFKSSYLGCCCAIFSLMVLRFKVVIFKLQGISFPLFLVLSLRHHRFSLYS